MALYDFKCSECGHEIEVLQKMSDPYPTTCPNCGKETLEKQISKNTGFCLMGGSWYKPGMTAGH